MRIEVIDALTGRTRCVLHLVTPDLAERIFDVYACADRHGWGRVRYIIQPNQTPPDRDPRHGEPICS